MLEAVTTAVAWLIRALVVTVLPVVAVVALAVAVGMVRTAALVVVFPLVALVVGLDRAASSIGHSIPLPRLPQLSEVVPR